MFSPIEDRIPKFDNLEDNELNSMVADGGLILSIQDENVSGEEEY